jgi:hypothetical protein
MSSRRRREGHADRAWGGGGQRRPVPRRALVAALVAAALLTGCGLGAGTTPTGVQLTVTRGFGAQALYSLHAPQVHGQETAMSLLMRNAQVTTRYGGGFVQSIDGRAGGYEGTDAVDWFYYVNGVQASKGAAETNVHPGDRVWWDLHDWSQTEEVPAVVGSFPEPFLHGIGGLRLPVRLECAQPQGDPCRTVAARLRAAGVIFGIAGIGPPAGAAETLRVLVGTWPQVRADPGVQSIESGPRASGVYVRVAAAGKAFALLNGQGATARTLTGAVGLIAATRYSGQAPEWVITGTDAAGLGFAAHALDEAALRDRFAVVLTAGRSSTGGVGLAAPQPSP